MKSWIVAVILLLSFQGVLLGQYGTAENGYYPKGYIGDTFTGEVVSTDDQAREVTLTHTNPKSGKTETFSGVLEEGYTVKLKDGTLHELMPSKIRPGAHLKVYYTATGKKVAGKKTTVNTIFLIDGTPNERVHLLFFRPFNGNL